MIQYLRLILLCLALLFARFFGATLEGFILDVVRFFVPLESSNALLFNAVLLAISLVPVLLFGLIVSISFSGEELFKKRLWAIVAGAALALIALRAYQLWWLFRGTGAEALAGVEESFSERELFYYEKAAPLILAGGSATFLVSLLERKFSERALYGALSWGSALLWLFITGKLQNLESASDRMAALAASLGAGASIFLLCTVLRAALASILSLFSRPKQAK